MSRNLRCSALPRPAASPSRSERDLDRTGEGLTAWAALRSYTLGGAFVTGREGCQDSIAPGLLADLVALDRDSFSIPPDELD
jgi:predicted amidohydrolase YtcJ